MATQTAERHTAVRTIAQYPKNEGWPTAAETIAQPEEKKAGFLSRIADALWSVSSRLSFSPLPSSNFSLPDSSGFRPSNTLPYREKAWSEAYRKYGPPN